MQEQIYAVYSGTHRTAGRVAKLGTPSWEGLTKNPLQNFLCLYGGEHPLRYSRSSDSLLLLLSLNSIHHFQKRKRKKEERRTFKLAQERFKLSSYCPPHPNDRKVTITFFQNFLTHVIKTGYFTSYTITHFKLCVPDKSPKQLSYCVISSTPQPSHFAYSNWTNKVSKS